MRPGEIAEDRLTPLENGRVPTLDQYAALAGSLTPAQRAALDSWRPLAAFPTTALRQGFWGLYVLSAVPPELRSQALTYDDLPSVAQGRWNEAVTEAVYGGSTPERWIDALLRGERPAGAGFAVTEEMQKIMPSSVAVGNGGSQSSQGYRTWVFRFGERPTDLTVRATTLPVAP